VVWHLRELSSDVGGEMHLPRFLGKRLMKHLLSYFSDQLICISHVVATNLLGNHLPDNTCIIPNAVDDSYFVIEDKNKARRQLALPAHVPVIGIPGTLRPLKGHDFLFRSAKKVLDRHPSAVIAISGTHSSPYAESVIQQAKSTGVAANCKFLGNILDMRNFYAASDIICVPSKSEPFGRTVIEAFAANRPVVASAVGGILETIKDGVNGFLVEYNDTEKLAEVLIELIENKTLARKISEEARNCVALEYTADICGNRIKDVINEATEQYAK
jgi:glycosyltransferase involved in cell wall biosynthesis